MKSILALLFLLLSSCVPANWPMTPEKGREGTYQLLVKLDGEPQIAGTTFVISNDDRGSTLLTAGHMCAGENELDYVLLTPDNMEFSAVEVKYSNHPDLCELRSAAHLGPSLAFAQHDLNFGQRVGYVGAPEAVWGNGASPLFWGTYDGGDLISISVAPGASGAALFTEHDGVFGVLVKAIPQMYAIFVGIDDITSFLNNTGTGDITVEEDNEK